jgi:hypothetical protein
MEPVVCEAIPHAEQLYEIYLKEREEEEEEEEEEVGR